ncbi:unnamed protein product [Mytilus coruscus]|uniref:RNase H type-1 domain-containing protein n=1 Tax=Mytilus coruscus TaxID=42192 RepID=A0A6J8AML2_MYTCO|nr:unnamed protein product [Mytilus coruscus]
MYSDASNFAAGAYSACQLDNTVFHKMWTDMEKKQSSTRRELKAIESCLDTLKTKLESKIVKWFTDNQNCVRIIQCGSRKQELHSLAMSIFSICLHRSISIDIQWIPRNLNTEADSISKIFDFDDWGVSTEFFEYLDSVFGLHSCDRLIQHWQMEKKFAMEKNNTLSELGSKLPELILGSKADNTRKKYNYGFKAWCKWCKNFNGVKSMPALDYHVCLYIISLLQTKCSVAKLDEVVYSLTWAHEIAGFNNPCKSLLVKSVVEGAKRQLCRPCMKKDIITPEILKNLERKKTVKKKMVPFYKRPLEEKDKEILGWFVSVENVMTATSGNLLDLTDITKETLPYRCLDEAVDILSVNKYFTDSALTFMVDLIHATRKDLNYIYCSFCNIDMNADTTEACDFDSGNAEIDAWFPGKPDTPILSIGQKGTCGDLKKIIPNITCPIKKKDQPLKDKINKIHQITDKSMLNFYVNIEKVHPVPFCTAMFNHENVTSGLKPTIRRNRSFYRAIFQLEFDIKDHLCKGRLQIHCSIGSNNSRLIDTYISYTCHGIHIFL